MSFSLYDAVVPTYLQTLGAVAALVGKAEAHCSANGIAPEEIILARLAPDMLPFAYQVKSTVVHSLGAIAGVRKGEFSPDTTPSPESFAVLTERVAQARSTLEKLEPAEIDGFVGRDMRFASGSRHVDYTAENFLLSFSQPNFYFHAATTYDILRWKGVALEKRDFMGKTRRKY